MTIWKYVLPEKRSTIALPKGAEVLSVGSQGSQLCLWARVYPGTDTEERIFYAYATGEQMSNLKRNYIGKAYIQQEVFHVYELLL